MENTLKISKLLIDGKTITKPAYKLWGLVRNNKEDDSIIINDIDYIDKVKLPSLFGEKWGVALIAGGQKVIYQPKLSSSAADELIKALVERGAKQGERKYSFSPESVSKFGNEYVMLCEEYGRMTKKTFTKSSYSAESVNLSKILFIDNVKIKGKKGLIFGSIAGGGNANTIEIVGLPKEINDKVYKMIIEHNPQLVAKPVKSFRSKFPLFKPSRWFKSRETIAITDVGLVHKQYGVKIDGKRYSVRTSVVPYESIKSYWAEGTFSKSMDILGSTSIKTIENYSNKVKDIIWYELMVRNVVNEYGNQYKARLFHRKGQGVFYINQTSVTFRQKKETLVLPYYAVYECEYKKPHWYSFFSGTVTVRGRRVDARKGEGGDIVMQVEKMASKKGRELVAIIKSRSESDRGSQYGQKSTIATETTPSITNTVEPKVEPKSADAPKTTELKQEGSKASAELKSEVKGKLGSAFGDKLSLKDLGSKLKK